MMTKSQKLCSLKSKKDGIIYDDSKLIKNELKVFIEIQLAKCVEFFRF